MKTYSRVILALALAFQCGCTRSGGAGREGEATVAQRMVAAEASAEILTWRGSDSGFAPNQITLERARRYRGKGSLWTARVPLDHFHSYTVLTHDGVAIPLGGFQSPAPRSAVRLLPVQASDSASALAVAKELIGLLDPNGAETIVFAGELGAEQAFGRAWARAGGFPWPSDTLLRRGTTWVVRLNVASQMHSYEGSWDPAVYTFVFTRTGELESWSVRHGNRFVPEPTVTPP